MKLHLAKFISINVFPVGQTIAVRSVKNDFVLIF